MTPTYDLIASNVLTSSASSVTFSSIPATYRDLVLVVEYLSATAGNAEARLRFNSDTGSNYSTVVMTGDGSTASSGTYSLTEIYGSNATTTDRRINIYQIMDYSATDKHKTVLIRSNRASGSGPTVEALAGRWANTAAINSITVRAKDADFASAATFYLYGIVA